MSSYRFWARAGGGPSVEAALARELNFLGATRLLPLRPKGYSALEFRASWPTLWNILYKSRVVESLQLKVGFCRARGKKELEANL